MEEKIKCPHCGRCIGIFQTTDKNNSVHKVSKIPIQPNSPKEHLFHCTCQRCKKEIYVLMGFIN